MCHGGVDSPDYRPAYPPYAFHQNFKLRVDELSSPAPAIGVAIGRNSHPPHFSRAQSANSTSSRSRRPRPRATSTRAARRHRSSLRAAHLAGGVGRDLRLGHVTPPESRARGITCSASSPPATAPTVEPRSVARNDPAPSNRSDRFRADCGNHDHPDLVRSSGGRTGSFGLIAGPRGESRTRRGGESSHRTWTSMLIVCQSLPPRNSLSPDSIRTGRPPGWARSPSPSVAQPCATQNRGNSPAPDSQAPTSPIPITESPRKGHRHARLTAHSQRGLSLHRLRPWVLTRPLTVPCDRTSDPGRCPAELFEHAGLANGTHALSLDGN